MSDYPNYSRPRQIPITQFYQPPPPLHPQPTQRAAPPPNQRQVRAPTVATTFSAAETSFSSHSSEAGWLPTGALPGGPPPLSFSVAPPPLPRIPAIEEHPQEGAWSADEPEQAQVQDIRAYSYQPSVSAYSVRLEPRPDPASLGPARMEPALAAAGIDRKPTLSAPVNRRAPPPALGQADRTGRRLAALEIPLAPPKAAFAGPPPTASPQQSAAKFGDSPASTASQKKTPIRVGSMDWSRFSVMMHRGKAEEYDRKFSDKDTTWLARKKANQRTCRRWAYFAGFLALCVLAGLLCWHFLTRNGTTEPRTLGGSKDSGSSSSSSSSGGSSGSGSGSATSSTTEKVGIHWNYASTRSAATPTAKVRERACATARFERHRRMGVRP